MCVSSQEIFWCNTFVMMLCPFVVFTAAWRRVTTAYRIHYKRGDLSAYHRSRFDFSNLPRNKWSAPDWTLKDWRPNPNCWVHKTQQMLSHSASLVLFDFCTFFSRWTSLIFTLHLTFCHSNPFSLSPSSHQPPTDSHKGGGRKNRPAHGNFLRRQAQHKDWTQISWMWQSSRDCSLHCSFFTPYWWFVPIRKYVSNSYTFMNMDQCGSFVLSTQWLQSSTSLLGDDILARQM